MSSGIITEQIRNVYLRTYLLYYVDMYIQKYQYYVFCRKYILRHLSVHLSNKSKYYRTNLCVSSKQV